MSPNKTAKGNTRRFGERLVFEPDMKEAHAQTFDRLARNGILAEGMGHGRYEDSVSSLRAG